ncbi:plasmid fertility inhibition factor family protein [Paraburkholderia fungorum]|uniref:plasmid fertility inhibition factor family protein n=1 Tax=Paraburkholderia fungorum TaxID=134537 RepID=UPI00402B72F8
MTKNTWRVHLGVTHTPYAYVEFKRSHEHAAGYTVVLVDVERLMGCFERDQLVIGRPTEWTETKREGIRQFLDPKEGACEMPVVGFSIRTRTHRRLLGFATPRIEKVPVAGFTNGRHRARYLQYAGAKVMPVEVHETEAALLREHCGASGHGSECEVR